VRPPAIEGGPALPEPPAVPDAGPTLPAHWIEYDVPPPSRVHDPGGDGAAIAVVAPASANAVVAAAVSTDFFKNITFSRIGAASPHARRLIV
jgi:hypothetical protein